MIRVKRNLKKIKIKITKVKHEVYIYEFILKIKNPICKSLVFVCEKRKILVFTIIFIDL